MNQARKILNIVYCFTILLFLADYLTSFDIKNQFLKSFVYLGFLIGTPTVLLWNLFSKKTNIKKQLGAVYPLIFFVLILVLNPFKILLSSNAWQTQTILYENGHLNFKTIEFQMQDIGARGYNKRNVEAFYLTPLFMVTKEVPTNIDNRVEWIRVDKVVNELELKYP